MESTWRRARRRSGTTRSGSPRAGPHPAAPGRRAVARRPGRVACFSPFHFHRIFAAYVQETVSAHVRRLRIERAAWRLCHTQESVTDVALDAGYETPGAFTKAFTQVLGENPPASGRGRQQACCRRRDWS